MCYNITLLQRFNLLQYHLLPSFFDSCNSQYILYYMLLFLWIFMLIYFIWQRVCIFSCIIAYTYIFTSDFIILLYRVEYDCYWNVDVIGTIILSSLIYPYNTRVDCGHLIVYMLFTKARMVFYLSYKVVDAILMSYYFLYLLYAIICCMLISFVWMVLYIVLLVDQTHKV